MQTAVFPEAVLRARHRALGPIEELPGERTYVGRCSTFAGFLECGCLCAELLREDVAAGGNGMSLHPALAELLLAAWPAAPRSEPSSRKFVSRL